MRRAFLNRPRLVEKAAGFCGLSVLTDAIDPSVFLLLTRWTDADSFRAWHRSDRHHHSHELIPHGLKLDATFTALTIGNAHVAWNVYHFTRNRRFSGRLAISGLSTLPNFRITGQIQKLHCSLVDQRKG